MEIIEEVSSKLMLPRTNDLDALLTSKWGEENLFRDILKTKGLVFDELSNEIWLPQDATFIEYYESPFVKVSYLDPISALTSKAIKAKEKNKTLITNALKIYGDKLASNIKLYGGDLAFFSEDTQLKL